jgi:hypothetical protein
MTTRIFWMAVFLFSTTSYGQEKVRIDAAGTPALAKRLEKIAQLKKDEFETTKQFESRKCAGVMESFGKEAGSEITFDVWPDPPPLRDNLVTYNADRKQFLFAPRTHGNYLRLPEDKAARFVWVASFDRYSHSGVTLIEHSNFAESRALQGHIRDGKRTELNLFFPSWSPTKMIKYPADPSTAKQLGPDLRVAVTAKLASPCIVWGGGHHPATRDMPYDFELTELGIVAQKSPKWLLYKASTKEVLATGRF